MGRAHVNTNLSPRHLQLRIMLFRRWKRQGAKPGDKIESQNQIIKFCGFSLITVIKTLKDLEAEGVIRRQVGKGSFLVKTPWAEGHWRVGLFYNRDIVGGGIFHNDFYTRLVAAFEKGVVSDGHEFILGSFTNTRLPIAMWDALDAVVLTGITDETRLDGLGDTSSQVSLIDMKLDDRVLHSYRLDYGPAFDAMFKHLKGQKLRYLYLDTVIASPEQAARGRAFLDAHAANGIRTEPRIITVNQEVGVADTELLEATIASYQPDVVCGYIHASWHGLIENVTTRPVKVYSYVLGSDQSGFVVDTADWMAQVLPVIYANLENRAAATVQHSYPARFNP
jgi:hypothetical protein